MRDRSAATLCTPLYDKSVNVLLTIAKYLTPFNSQWVRKKTTTTKNTRTIAFVYVCSMAIFYVYGVPVLSDLSDGKHLKILNWILVHRTSILLPLSMCVCVCAVLLVVVICVKCLLLWNALKIYHSTRLFYSLSLSLSSFIAILYISRSISRAFPSSFSVHYIFSYPLTMHV